MKKIKCKQCKRTIEDLNNLCFMAYANSGLCIDCFGNTLPKPECEHEEIHFCDYTKNNKYCPICGIPDPKPEYKCPNPGLCSEGHECLSCTCNNLEKQGICSQLVRPKNSYGGLKVCGNKMPCTEHNDVIDTPHPKSSWEDGCMEQLADIEHQRWADWHLYVRSKMIEENSYLLPIDLVDRWDNQANTNYYNLSEEDKEKDREQVRRYLPIISQVIQEEVENERESLVGEIEKMKITDDYYWKKLSMGYCNGFNKAINDLLSLLKTR